jgi:hypothetical protein
MIMKAPYFPEKQFVPLLQHDESPEQRLVLAPLSKDSSSPDPDPAISTPTTNKLPRNYLDLRLRYDDPLDEKEVKKLASQIKMLIEEGSIGARRIGWLGLQKRDWEFSSSAAETWKSDVIKNTSEPSMGGNIISPADFCNSIPSGSNTGQSAISPRSLESPDVSKVENSMIGSMDISSPKQKAMEMANCNLGTKAERCISREGNNNRNENEPIFAVSFDYIRHQSRDLLRGMQDISPALGVAVAMVLVLSIHSRYAPSLRSISLFKNW